jgi:hypothetical protein
VIETAAYTLWTGAERSPFTRHTLHFWALSVGLAARWFPHVVLVADARAREVLVELLELPFTDVAPLPVVPERLRFLPLIGKVYGMSAMIDRGAPFAHADGDLFWWRRPDTAALEAAGLAQCRIAVPPGVGRVLAGLQSAGVAVPAWGNSCNAGVMGGNDLETLARWRDLAIRTVEDPRHDALLRSVEDWSAASAFDEGLYSAHFGIRLKYLMEQKTGGPEDAEKFERAGLTHLAGMKTDPMRLLTAEMRLGLNFPVLYERVQRVWYDRLAATETRRSARPGNGAARKAAMANVRKRTEQAEVARFEAWKKAKAERKAKAAEVEQARREARQARKGKRKKTKKTPDESK